MSKYETFQTAKFNAVDIDMKKPVIIKPFGDVHRDSHNCDVDRWNSWCKRAAKEHTPQTFYIGLGDYNDFASFSERKKLRDLHESTTEKFDMLARQDIARFCEDISFMKGNLIGLIHGNHEYIFQDGRLSTEIMCELLGCNFLGYAGYVRLSIIPTSKSRRSSIDIFAAHGKGAGRLLGSTINNVERMTDIFPNADIYLMGHDHKRMCAPKTTLMVEQQNMMVKERVQWFGRTGSFLRGFVEDTPSYAVGRMYAPTSLGTIEFHIELTRKCSGKSDTILKTIRGIA